MRLRESLTLALVLTFVLGVSGCATRPLAAPGGVALQPGHYLQAYYRAPDFAPEQVSYALEPFPVAQAQGVAPEAFQSLLQRELAQAWTANGLKLTPPGAQTCLISGTVAAVKVRGARLRWLIGRIAADFTVSGTIRRGDRVLFAFEDRVQVISPINPGPAPPKETELLLAQVARTFASHLLDEILVHGFTAEAG